MSYDCYCDYDPPEFFDSHKVKARKPHRCCECRGKIQPGEIYLRNSGKWDGGVNTFHMCIDCKELMHWAEINFPCLCPVFGELFEQIYDKAEEAECEAKGILAESIDKMETIKEKRRDNYKRPEPDEDESISP